MSYQPFKRYSLWASQIAAAASLINLIYLKSIFIFDPASAVNKWLVLIFLTTVLSFVFGLVALPRWQGFVALTASGIVFYYVLVEGVLTVA